MKKHVNVRIIRATAAILVTLLFLLMPAQVCFAEGEETQESTTPSQDKRYQNNKFTIDKFDVHVKVNENNTLDITETITAMFLQAQHGIYRDIPLNNTVKRQDGTTTRNHTRVTDISVSENYESSNEDGMIHLKIGDPDDTVTGEKTYVISYNYNLGKDPLEGKDEFYFNLIGSGWTTAIGNVTFTIEMPKDFDPKSLGFSSGWVNTAGSDLTTWDVKGRTITGSYYGILEPGQALTVRLELPDGYFVDAGLENTVMDIICFSIPILGLIISFLLWFRFGKDDMVVDTVEFYPPDGINSLETGFLYRGRAVGSDVTSLLIYLANRGYIRIEETEEKGLFKKKETFRFVKLKDYDGDDKNEEEFMEGLFGGSDSVTAGALYNSFYLTTNKILTHENRKEHMHQVFDKTTGSKSAVILLLILISSVAIFVPPILTYDTILTLPFALFPILGFGIFFSMVLGGKGKGRSKGKMNRGCGTFIFGLIFAVAFGVAPVAALIFPMLAENALHMVGFLVGFACIFGMVLFLTYMPKRTPYGITMLGRIEGFRNFLETAEKEQLEQMVLQDPKYFYNILPYTYVLGVSDKWMKKFETIQMQAPDWYGGYYYDMHTFSDRMDRTMETATRAMTSSPSESSGGSGGGGGGGFSGGGSGGGGGGSW